MEIIERSEFWDRYHFRPTQLDKLKDGETYTDKCGTFQVIRQERSPVTGMNTCIVYEHDGVQTAVDLYPHWERGPADPIKLSRDGTVHLICAVMAQAEKDLEQYYAGGEVEFQVEPLIGSNGKAVFETKEQMAKRRKMYYQRAVKECEELLGSVFSKYAKIKAYYNILHLSIDEIAKRTGETTEHIIYVADRLGLNRADSGQGDTLYDTDEDFTDD